MFQPTLNLEELFYNKVLHDKKGILIYFYFQFVLRTNQCLYLIMGKGYHGDNIGIASLGGISDSMQTLH